MQKLLFALTFAFALTALNAQSGDWVEQMDDPSVNFYTVQQNFEKYWQEHQVEKGKGWKQFKRWEAFMEPRVYPDGERPSPNIMMGAFQQIQGTGGQNIGQWKPMGPYNGATLNGIGRINRIAFDPNDGQTIWIGAPAGGLWKSTNGGLNWTTNTDHLANLGISDIEINPQNTDIMYVATGDRDGADTYSFGVLKSTDGGQTWNQTGLVHTITQQIRITDIYINPDNPSIILATTSQGIYRSTDGGNNWTRTRSGSYNAMVQKPGNPDVLFCTSLTSPRIYKSEDNGQTWTQVISGNLPSGNVRRIELAVTPHDSNYIYALYGESSTNGFLAICRSTDGGDTWTQQATSPNLLGWRTSGTDVGGQAWYDLALAVSPTDKNEVYVGGVNIWRSSNGGVNWSLAAHWTGSGGAPFVHADIHHLIYHPVSGHLYAGTDGGVYRHKKSQFNWDELNVGLNITQYYKMGTSASDTSRIIAGAQDNGTHLVTSNGWNRVYGGDGMDCAISSKNPNVMYASIYYGDFVKSTNGGSSFFASFNLPPAGTGNWVTPFMLDPKHPDTIYAGFRNVWRSFNGGQSFTDLTASSISGMSNVDVLGIAPNNTNIVFMANGNRIYRSTNYGNTWTHLNALSVMRSISSIATAYDDPDHIVVSISGYSSTEKVFETRNGGQSWTNISTGLPNLPVNCVTIEDNTERSVYIGTDVGVYYRDDLSNGWIRFSGDLPNVIVNDLEINYQNRKLRAATYGRGVWETPLYSDLVPPNAAMDLPQNVCLNDTVTLYDDSEYSPNQFKWYISPSTYTFVNGTTDTTRNPQVVFSQKGFYNISLKVNNMLGNDSTFEAGAIAVGGYPLPFNETFTALADFNKWTITDMDPLGWSRQSINGEMVLKASLYNNPALKDYRIISPAIDFTGHDSVWLSFEHAYSGQPSNSNDSLLIFVATGCSNNWIPIASLGENGSNNFRTSSTTVSNFIPGATQWCGNANFASCNQLNLSTYAGMEGVRLMFVAVNKSGNNLYIDNVRLEGNPIVSPSPGFSARTAACAMDTVTFRDQSYGSPQSWEWDFSGPVNFTSLDRNPKIQFTTPGTYTVKLKTTNGIGVDSISKPSYITINPADSVNINLNYSGVFTCTNDTLPLTANSVNAGSNPIYSWYLNGQFIDKTSSAGFDFTGLKNGDSIFAVLVSDLPCAFPAIAYSDTIIVNVHPIPSLQISPVNLLCSTGSPVNLSATPAGGSFSGPGVGGGSFDPQVAGSGIHTITYTYQDNNGCTYTSQENIEVQNPPTISISNNYTICEGDSPKQLNVALPAGGNYSGPGISNNILDPSVPGAGTHSITYTFNSATCGPVTKTFSINISQTDTPDVYMGNNQLACSVTASAYQWFDSNNKPVIGANSKTFTPTSNGSYRVDIIDNNGCYAKSAYASFSIGLDEIPPGMEFNLYPNPANDILRIEISGAPAAADIEFSLYNGVGSLVRQQKLPAASDFEQAIRIRELAPGVYTLIVRGNDLLIDRKVIIQR